MLNNNTKKEILERILKSDEFASSQVYQKLLVYLVNASIENRTLKEYTIALEFFNKNTDFNSAQDTIVRVHIYNLRKKLENYYNKQGKGEKIKMHIPRGHYEISYASFSPVNDTKSIQQYRLIIAVLSILLVVCTSFLFRSLIVGNKKTIKSIPIVKQSIWTDFFSSSKEKMIVIGDHFFYVLHPTSDRDRLVMRRDDINSLEEYSLYRAHHPELNDSRELLFPLFPKNSIWPFIDLMTIFNKMNMNYILRYTSSVTATEIKNYNTIFVGSFHTLGAFGKMFRNSRFEYSVYPNSFTLKDENNNIIKKYGDTGNPNLYHTDYGIARKIPGPDKTIIFIFTSFHDTGTVGIVKYFTDEKNLKELETLFINKYNHVPDFFDIIFKASGYNRTVYKTEIISVFEIMPEAALW